MSKRLLDGLGEALQQPALSRCGIAKIFVQLGPEDTTVLTEVLANKALSAQAIAAQLTSRGLTASGQVVLRHRLGRCSCPVS